MESCLILHTRDTEISIDTTGKYSSVKICGEEILSSGIKNVISICTHGEIKSPVTMDVSDNVMTFTFPDSELVGIRFNESDISITYEVISLSDEISSVVFGPAEVTICDVVGDVVGVVQGETNAFGVQSLNIKTVAGVPEEYGKQAQKLIPYSANSINTSVGNIIESSRAAAKTEFGSVLHLFCKRRDNLEYLSVMNAENSLVLPIEGDDAQITGAKIALFGCKKSDALSRIGEIEIEHNLPHPMFDGEWGKTARAAMKSYIISDFSADDWNLVIEKCKIAGLEYMYQEGIFEDWGHFTLGKNSYPGGDEQLRELVDVAAQNGIKVGVHTLSNFSTTNDAYVTPVPSEHLLKQCKLTLTKDISENDTEIDFELSEFFKYPLSLNTVQIGSELIRWSKSEEADGVTRLTGCERGAFKTSASSHSADEKAYRLWDYPYNTFFPDIELQDEFADRIAELYNKTGLAQISFDGLEGCTYTGHGQYAVNRFVDRIWNKWNHNVLNDASRLDHWTWHMATRMNWGEPWGEAMRVGQTESRIKNQDFFRRNLFSRMLGWFLIRLSERKFECSTLEDLEWALSESAGFDAGYGMTIRVGTLKKHGQIDTLLEAMKNWDSLRLSHSFSDEQKIRLKDPKTEWHLEKIDDETYNLYPMMITKPFVCDLSEMQPGQSGGSDWSVESEFEGKFAFRLRVEGEGEIRNPTFITPNGRISFECTIEDSQYLLYSFDGTAVVTDRNYNTIEKAGVTGDASLIKGANAVAFSCEHDKSDTPEITVRFMTRGDPDVVRLRK